MPFRNCHIKPEAHVAISLSLSPTNPPASLDLHPPFTFSKQTNYAKSELMRDTNFSVGFKLKLQQ